MAARFWVGGTGNWDATTTTNWSASSGGAGGASVPTSADDVTFDSASGTATTVTITAAANANSITINKSDLTLLHNAGSTVVGIVTLTTGTLNTNSQNCTWGSFVSNVANTRVINLGSSTITITGGGVNAWAVGQTSLSGTLSSSTISLTGAGQQFSGGTILNYGTVSLTGSGVATVLNTASVTNLTRIGTATTTDGLNVTSAITVSQTFTATGASVTNRLLVQSGTPGTSTTITAAAISLSNVDFMDMTGAGLTGNAAWTGTSLGDCLGNSNITFDTPVTRYAVVAGNWSSTAMWSASSGGAGGATVPLAQDTVVFDANSAAGTYSCNMPRAGNNITFTGFTRTLSMTTVNVSIFGSLTLSNGMTFSGTKTVILSGRSSQTITSAGKLFPAGVTQVAPGGTYTLVDTFACAGTFTLSNGTFDTNNQPATFFALTSSVATTRALTLGTSTILLSGTSGTVLNFGTGASLTVSAGQSTFVISTISASLRIFAGGGKTFGTLTYTIAGSTGALQINASNTFDTINFFDASNARTLTMAASVTTTITNSFNVHGFAGNLVTINSTGAAATLSKSTGMISCDYLSIQNSNAGGGATWYAGANSTDLGGNTGWVFTAPPAGRGGFLPYF